MANARRPSRNVSLKCNVTADIFGASRKRRSRFKFPTLGDLIDLCRELNRRGVRYIVIGGMAMAEHGLPRFTEDPDLLYETSRENQAKLREALALPPEKAILYHAARERIMIRQHEDVSIPYANAELLLETKRTWREKDQLDAAFLRDKIARTTNA